MNSSSMIEVLSAIRVRPSGLATITDGDEDENQGQGQGRDYPGDGSDEENDGTARNPCLTHPLNTPPTRCNPSRYTLSINSHSMHLLSMHPSQCIFSLHTLNTSSLLYTSSQQTHPLKIPPPPFSLHTLGLDYISGLAREGVKHRLKFALEYLRESPAPRANNAS